MAHYVVTWTVSVDDAADDEAAAVEAVRIWRRLREHALQVQPVSPPVSDPEAGRLAQFADPVEPTWFRVADDDGIAIVVPDELAERTEAALNPQGIYDPADTLHRLEMVLNRYRILLDDARKARGDLTEDEMVEQTTLAIDEGLIPDESEEGA